MVNSDFLSTSNLTQTFFKYHYLNCHFQVVLNPIHLNFGSRHVALLELWHPAPGSWESSLSPLPPPCPHLPWCLHRWHLSRLCISSAMGAMSNSTFLSLETCFDSLFQMLQIIPTVLSGPKIAWKNFFGNVFKSHRHVLLCLFIGGKTWYLEDRFHFSFFGRKLISFTYFSYQIGPCQKPETMPSFQWGGFNMKRTASQMENN